MTAHAPAQEDALRWYEQMLAIRAFEERVSELYALGAFKGTTHLCQGQEAVAVGVAQAAARGDVMTCTYRGHGHCLAWGMSVEAAFAEILGRATGCCKGKGGSMHLTDVARGILGSFAIVGAGLPVAAGAAWAARVRGTSEVAFTFFGDGTANIGAFHETLNIAAIWKLPVVFVCENNLWGEYTPIAASTPVTDLAVRATAYAMAGEIVDGNDVLAVYEAAAAAAARARAGEGPTLLEMKTYRQKGHSRGDPGTGRPKEEIAAWLAKDPIPAWRERLMQWGFLSEETDAVLSSRVAESTAEASAAALAAPFPGAEEVATDVG
ncbi:MAG: thiamine pyrophosphate-dependent dehydrogenase E1 component subunit alpha [Candidatus Binatia bacterium]